MYIIVINSPPFFVDVESETSSVPQDAVASYGRTSPTYRHCQRRWRVGCLGRGSKLRTSLTYRHSRRRWRVVEFSLNRYPQCIPNGSSRGCRPSASVSVEKFTCITHAFFFLMKHSVHQLAQTIYSMIAPFRREVSVKEYVNSSLSIIFKLSERRTWGRKERTVKIGTGKRYMCSQLDSFYSFAYFLKTWVLTKKTVTRT